MPKIDNETVKKVASLAKLSFNEKELATYSEKFSRIVEYVAQLNKLDTTGIEPTSHALENRGSALREDTVVKFEAVEEILNNAPKKDGRFIEVPKVLE